MRKLYFLFLVLSVIKTNSQIDSISIQPISVKQDKFTYKKLIVPTGLMVTGFLLRKSSFNKDVASFRERNFPNFNEKADDYLQYVPILLTYTGNYLGFKSKHGYKQMITNHLISTALITGVAFTIKQTLKDPRPDETGQNSFPSGHTANSFSNATLHYLEYKDSNIWFASTGFVFATTTGFMRVLNNRHWLSDITAGAGLGMVTAIAIFYINPFNFDNIGKNKGQVLTYPIIDNKAYGIGLLYRFK